MARARKCDRCGKLYETYNTKNDEKKINGLMTLNIDDDRRYYSHGIMDLCPECMEEFQRWIKEKNKL